MITNTTYACVQLCIHIRLGESFWTAAMEYSSNTWNIDLKKIMSNYSNNLSVVDVGHSTATLLRNLTKMEYYKEVRIRKETR